MTMMIVWKTEVEFDWSVLNIARRVCSTRKRIVSSELQPAWLSWMMEAVCSAIVRMGTMMMIAVAVCFAAVVVWVIARSSKL